ncbi:MAG: hypothetical protein ACK5LY_05725 [Lachnospirales bacterium]
MSIRPIDMQVSVNKTAMVNKAHNTQSNLERAVVDDTSQRNVQKNIDNEAHTVLKSGKEKTDVNKDGGNREKSKYNSKERKKKEEALLKSKKNDNHHRESFFDIGV